MGSGLLTAGSSSRSRRPPDSAAGHPDLGARPGWRRLRISFPSLGVLYLALGLVIALTNSPGWYVYDARFEHYWAPERFLAQHLELWDGTRTLGRPTAFFSPVVGVVLSAFRQLGASPLVAERLLHGCYLAVAGLGMVALLKLYRPRLGPEHLLAGLLYVCNPFTTQFLVPSGLYLHAAVAPLLVVAAVRGARGTDPWRWAAMFALLVASLGAVNSASLLYAVLPAGPALVHAVLVERDVSPRLILAWVWRTAVLSATTCAAALIVLRANVPLIAENLGTTELPELVSSRSSWAESWRGLGSWQSYVRFRGAVLRPGAQSFFTSLPVILATYALPLLAVLGLARSRWRGRSAVACMALVSLVAMVGIHPVGSAPPVGQLIEATFDRSVFARSFRNGYKAAPGLLMFVGAMIAIGVVDLARSWPRRGAPARRILRRAVTGLTLLAVVGLSANPFWTGELYSDRDRAAGVPGYWERAIDWLDRSPQAGRALILPGVNRARYTWGFVGDDIFDALLRRDHVSRTSLAQGTPLAAGLVVGIDDAVAEGTYRPGAIRELARRAGIRFVVVRNDLDWRSLNAPRPALLGAVRTDPALRLAATFGARGEGILDAGDGTELGLHPVEVFEVLEVDPGVRVEPPTAGLLVSGDGAGLTTLAGLGWLEGRGPVRYSASLDADGVTAAVDVGAEVVVTDSNRRRIVRTTSTRNEASETLTTDVPPGPRVPQDLFGRPGSQTTVRLAHGVRGIRASATAGAFSTFEPGARAALAFDGSEESAWTIRGPGSGPGERLYVELLSPTVIDEVEVVAARFESSEREITQVTVSLDDGTERSVALANGVGVADMGGRRSSSVEVRIDGVTGDGARSVGLAEVRIAGLDLAEFVVAPDDLQRTAPRAAASAPTSYVFERARRSRGQDEEVRVRRSFASLGSRRMVLRGTLQVDASTPPHLADDLASSLAGQSATDCRPFVMLDGRPVGVSVQGSRTALALGRPVPFVACDDLVLAPGAHELVTSSAVDGMVADVSLVDERSQAPRPVAAPGSVVRWSTQGTTAHGVVDTPDGGFLILDQAHDRGWWATVDGLPVRATALDGMAGWTLGPGRHEVTVEYRPQRAYEIAVVLSAGAVGWCLWLLVDRRRRPAVVGVPGEVTAPRSDLSALTSRRLVAQSLGGAAIGYALAGGLGAVVGLGAGAVAKLHRRGAALLTAGGLAATAVAAIVEAPLAAARIGAFVADRPVTGLLGRQTGVLFACTLLSIAIDDRRPVSITQPRRHLLERISTAVSTGWDRRLRGALAATFFGGAAAIALDRADLFLAAIAGGGVFAIVAGTSGRWASDARIAGVGQRGHLLTGSMWVMAGFVVQAITGLVFWVGAARLHPAPTIGAATALFSSLQFINYATNLGIQDLLSRFHRGRRGRVDSLLTWSVALSIATSVAGTVAFLLVAPAAVTRAFDATGWGWGAATVTVLCAGSALVAAVDARLMAARRWRMVFWRLVIVGAARLPLLAIPTPRAAALWIFVVIAAPIALSGYLGLALALRVTDSRLSFRPRPSSSQVRFAGAAWLTNVLVLSPQFALPVVVLANVDAPTNAAFFLAWSIVAVVTVLPVVTSRVLVTEGTRADADADHHTRSALTVAVGASAVATLSAVLLHPLVAMLYGSTYARVADLLPALCAGAVPWAVTAVLLGRGRLRSDSRTMLITTSVMAVGVVGGALLLTPAHGVSGAVAAWIGGNALSAGTALMLERRAAGRPSASEPDTRSVVGTAR